MDAINLSEITAADKLICARISEAAGVDFKDCYQCGKCTAGCPPGREYGSHASRGYPIPAA